MTDSNAILPCPFCGGEAEAVHEINGTYTVECIKCGAMTDSIEAWNTRTEWVTCKCGEDIERFGRIQVCPSCGRKVIA